MLNLKAVIPEQLAVVAQPSKAELATFVNEGFKTLINNRPDHESPDQPTASEMRAAAKEHGLHYVHIPVTAGSIRREDVDAFRKALESEPTPVVAHCGSGKRSYLLWAAGEVLYNNQSDRDLVEQAKEIGLDASDLPRVVEQVR